MNSRESESSIASVEFNYFGPGPRETANMVGVSTPAYDTTIPDFYYATQPEMFPSRPPNQSFVLPPPPVPHHYDFDNYKPFERNDFEQYSMIKCEILK